MMGLARPAPQSRTIEAMTFEERLRQESLRLYDRYAREIVEGLSFCPYAASSREAGRVSVVALISPLDATSVAVAIEAIAMHDEADIGIVLLPLFSGSRGALSRFAGEVRELIPSRDARSFAIADFHPDSVPSIEAPGDFTSFIRRTPDPTLQLVRMSALNQVRTREGHGSGFVDPSQLGSLEALRAPTQAPLHERIADLNRATVARAGLAAIEARLEAIHRDRRDTHARIREEFGL